MTIYRELRCAACSKLLAVGSGSVQIKCQRCKTVNQFSSLTTWSTQSAETANTTQKGTYVPQSPTTVYRPKT
ncbi:zinc finger domain-containing protein [Neisseria elongata]|uniref:zinc finger domain-containing protein n=1 Tax=Neisseria elongata TaxID=495 RepID=UPI0002FB8CCE|nr:Com family DNA-binding transcriptional regulator [Neisseria elongata]SQH50145.1 Mu-like prophage protein Com [Neisseria elongata subsp. glycolytica]